MRALSADEVAGLEILPAGVVDLRRDVYRFVRFVEDKGLVRTHRENRIPKGAARRLAKILSYAGEAGAVEDRGYGLWSERVAEVARHLGLVSFDTEGEYAGYTSVEPSFPDNEIEVEAQAWEHYLRRSPLEKEGAILAVYLDAAGNELFERGTLVDDPVFDGFGSALGPASRMQLPRIRRELLAFLAELEANVWYEYRNIVERLRARAPHLILDPATRGPDGESQQRLREWEYRDQRRRVSKPQVSLEDIYSNFRELSSERDRWGARKPRQITADMPDAFHRVEGRYLEYFLRGTAYECGLVDLAYRRQDDPNGLDVVPPLGRLRAVRLRPRLTQLLAGEPAVDRVKVTALPTFEVIVEAPSFPDSTLQALEPYTKTVQEDAPIYRLRLEKKRVVEEAAGNPDAPPLGELLAELTGASLPENVAVELAAWAGHGTKVICYAGFGLLELHPGAEKRAAILDDLAGLIEHDGPGAFALVRKPQQAFARLEKGLRIPLMVRHRKDAFAAGTGPLGVAPGEPAKAARPAPDARAPPAKVRLESEDLVGLRASEPALLEALHEALHPRAKTCLLAGPDLLILSSADLPRMRAALRRLSERFAVDAAGGAAP